MTTRASMPPAAQPDANGEIEPCANRHSRFRWELQMPLGCVSCEPKSDGFVRWLADTAVEIVRDRAARGEGAA